MVIFFGGDVGTYIEKLLRFAARLPQRLVCAHVLVKPHDGSFKSHLVLTLGQRFQDAVESSIIWSDVLSETVLKRSGRIDQASGNRQHRVRRMGELGSWRRVGIGHGCGREEADPEESVPSTWAEVIQHREQSGNRGHSDNGEDEDSKRDGAKEKGR